MTPSATESNHKSSVTFMTNNASNNNTNNIKIKHKNVISNGIKSEKGSGSRSRSRDKRDKKPRRRGANIELANSIVFNQPNGSDVIIQEEEKEPPKNQRGKKKIQREVIYPIFIDACKSIEDPFWKDVLTNAAKGVFPKGFNYDGEYLIQRIRNKSNKTKLENTDENITETIIREFRKVRGMVSDIDRENTLKFLEEYTDENNNIIDWSKNSICKSQMISNYVDIQKKKLNLDEYACKSLKSVIHCGLFMKWINEEDIEHSDIVIKNIHNIEYDAEINLFYIKDKRLNNTKKHSRKVVSNTGSGTKKNDKYKIWRNLLNYNNIDVNKARFELDNNQLIRVTTAIKGKSVVQEASVESEEEEE